MFDLSTTQFTSKVVTTVTEYLWDVTSTWVIFVSKGPGSGEERRELKTRTGTYEVKTTSDHQPHPDMTVRPAVSLELTWLLSNVKESGFASFRINREDKHCHTPRRNSDVKSAVDAFQHFARFGHDLTNVVRMILDLAPTEQSTMPRERPPPIFVPCLPLLRSEEDTGVEGESTEPLKKRYNAEGWGAGLFVGDATKLLSEELRGIHEMKEYVSKIAPASDAGSVISCTEMALLELGAHCVEVAGAYVDAMDYIESMLRNQVIAAIGKVVTPADFAGYMQYHNRKLFALEYQPQPFCFAVRRSEGHGPEGFVSIEERVGSSGVAQPVQTISRKIEAGGSMMEFSLTAATRVRFGGDRHLHALLRHNFSDSGVEALSLRAQTRQFSSYILCVGRIASNQLFEPTYATMIQNKDDLEVPLELEPIPAAKAFKDAIASLSSEQQDFAKAFRGMQLESTLFGILIIQVKPLMERVLNLPADSLTKHIRLSQAEFETVISTHLNANLNLASNHGLLRNSVNLPYNDPTAQFCNDLSTQLYSYSYYRSSIVINPP